jgi:hypothetical protein
MKISSNRRFIAVYYQQLQYNTTDIYKAPFDQKGYKGLEEKEETTSYLGKR